MAYIASVLVRSGSAWTGRDLDLSEVTDLDELTDQLREEDATTTLVLIEEDDEYLAIVRIDGDDDLRVFVSDGRVLEASGVAGRLLADAVEAAAVAADALDADPDAVDDEDEQSGRPEVEPAGDDALLTDLGVPGPALLELCAEEGMLPSDVIFAVAERIGAAEVLEAVRGVV